MSGVCLENMLGTYMGASLHISLNIWKGNTLQNVILEARSPVKSFWNLISFKKKKKREPTRTKYHMLGALWESESFSSLLLCNIFKTHVHPAVSHQFCFVPI